MCNDGLSKQVLDWKIDSLSMGSSTNAPLISLTTNSSARFLSHKTFSNGCRKKHRLYRTLLEWIFCPKVATGTLLSRVKECKIVGSAKNDILVVLHLCKQQKMELIDNELWEVLMVVQILSEGTDIMVQMLQTSIFCKFSSAFYSVLKMCSNNDTLLF